MKPAIIIVDMIEDFISSDGPLPVGEEGLKIIPSIKKLLKACREKSVPIVFANDALQPDDFLFQSRMKPHGIKDTSGTNVINELKPEAFDLVVRKPRFSAFFKTDLDSTLRERGIDTLVIGGVATEMCVFLTAYDGISHGFRVIVLEDCCASRFKNTHHQIIEILKGSPLYSLLRIMTLSDFLLELN